MTWREWYNALEKPFWTPESSTIGLIWWTLYPVIIFTFGYVFVQTIRGRLPRFVAIPFVVNISTNLLFMPLFALMRSIPLSAVDIVLVWASIIWCMVAIWPYRKWVAIAQVPYLIWVSTATTLQLSIWAMNGAGP